MVSDIVLERELPEAVRTFVAAVATRIAGAALKGEHLRTMQDAGFERIEMASEKTCPIDSATNYPDGRILTGNPAIPRNQAETIADSILSIRVRAPKVETPCARGGICL